MGKSLLSGQRNREHVLLGIFDALLDSDRHFLALAHANAYAAVAVTDDDQSSQSKATTALNNLGNTIDVNHALLKLRNGRLVLFFFARSHLPTLS